MHATGDEISLRFLEVGALKRMCDKISEAMRIINDQELTYGMELSLPDLKADLTALAEKSFRDRQADQAIVVAASIDAPVAPNAPTLNRKARAAAARAAAIAAAAAAVGAVCWNHARRGTCNKQLAGTCDKAHIDIPQCRVPPGKCLGLIHLPNNPIILKPKRARNTSRKSPTKSLAPNLINPVSFFNKAREHR
jgi:hypothetical protein